MPNSVDKFHCEKCAFVCSKKSNYERHLLTAKHLNRTESTQKRAKRATEFACQKCNKVYKSRSGIWNHSKVCTNESNDQILHYLMKENKELKSMVIDICKHNSNVITNNNNITHNNNQKTFNLNLFLNEECKNAMNITDFVDSVQLQLDDLEHVGKVGYVNGISNIIIKRLQALDVNMRPVHCSDFKRETIYVKDENKWEKENEQKERLRKVIKEISSKNTKMLPQYKSKKTTDIEKYNEILIESFGGTEDNDVEHQNKIMKKIAKQFVIDK